MERIDNPLPGRLTVREYKDVVDRKLEPVEEDQFDPLNVVFGIEVPPIRGLLTLVLRRVAFRPFVLTDPDEQRELAELRAEPGGSAGVCAASKPACTKK